MRRASKRRLQPAAAEGRIGGGIGAVADLVVHEENGGRRRPPLAARQIQLPAGLAEPRPHVGLELRPLRDAPAGDVGVEELLQRRGALDALNDDAARLAAGSVRSGLAHERGVEARLIVAEPRQLAAERRVVVARAPSRTAA